ncbi:MAG: AAA family ATPase [Proteobacteria bacterium]|nr:AAA family ATPase [Pseudomonadota bacterium]
MNSIYGRNQEIKTLEALYKSDQAEFLAVYGRRRVGKTFLISEFFKNKGIYFELAGIKDAKLSVQLNNFTVEFSDLFYDGVRQPVPANWFDAFTRLRHRIEKTRSDQRIILFFDEIPWLVTPKSNFLQALDHLWNRYLSRDKRVILIICGSAASWMIKNIINSKGGLHGRISREIKLRPFYLAEVEEYLKTRDVHLTRKQLLEIYMAMGGVAKYLTYIERGKSAAQIIGDVCFSESGGLFREFNRLYASLFNHYENHIGIIRELARNRSGWTKDALLQRTGMKSGGSSSNIFSELEESSFIAYMPPFGRRKNGGKYRLIDEYSIFYLKWVENAPNIGLGGADNDYWVKKRGSAAWRSWSGYAFEAICLKHIENIKKALGISGVSTAESCWFIKPEKDSVDRGAQIDIVIDRADGCINLCEIKFSDSKFVVDKKFVVNQRHKIERFKTATQTRKSIFTTLITTFGAEENPSYHEIIDNQLTMDDLF